MYRITHLPFSQLHEPKDKHLTNPTEIDPSAQADYITENLDSKGPNEVLRVQRVLGEDMTLSSASYGCHKGPIN